MDDERGHGARGGGAPTILVVDDDPSITTLLETALDDEGYQVVAAMGRLSLHLAHTLQPAAILLDLLMPSLDGRGGSRRLHADPATADIPIIAMSAKDRLDAEWPALGARDRLPKPFELEYLYATVGRWAGA